MFHYKNIKSYKNIIFTISIFQNIISYAASVCSRTQNFSHQEKNE